MIVEEILNPYRDNRDAKTEFTAKLIRKAVKLETINEILEEFSGGYYPITEGGIQCNDCIIKFVQQIIKVGNRS